jgi:hypothetical protein
MTPRSLADLTGRERRRAVIRTLVRFAVIFAAIFGGYHLLPLVAVPAVWWRSPGSLPALCSSR